MDLENEIMVETVHVYFYKYNKKLTKLRIYEGHMVVVNDYSATLGNYNLVLLDSSHLHRSLKCSSAEGKVFNGSVWLKEQDVNKATDILSEYYKNRIATLKQREERFEKIL